MPPAPASQASSQGGEETLQPLAVLLAVAFPGLGHFYLGHTRRAALISAGILSLYLTGIFVGGVSCIDRRDNFIWFLGQVLVGPITLGLDYVHQNHLKVLGEVPAQGPGGRATTKTALRPAKPDETRDPNTGRAVPLARDGKGRLVLDSAGRPTAVTPDGRTIDPAYPPYIKATPRANEIGTLFTTIAGFLNVIVVIDAAMNHRVQRRRRPADTGVARTLRSPQGGAA